MIRNIKKLVGFFCLKEETQNSVFKIGLPIKGMWYTPVECSTSNPMYKLYDIPMFNRLGGFINYKTIPEKQIIYKY